MKTWNEYNYTEVPVVSNTQIAEGAWILSFERNFDFLAGQVIALGVTPDIAPRLYSVASGEKDILVEILYTEKLDGKLTPMLSLLKPGEKLMVSEHFGTFTQVDDSAVYVAAGTGIAPFISRILSGKGESPTLIHGASYPEFFYYENYLNEKLGKNYIQCCSRCDTDEVFQGRVPISFSSGKISTPIKSTTFAAAPRWLLKLAICLFLAEFHSEISTLKFIFSLRIAN